MLTKDVESYFGNLRKAAEAIGITKSASYAWGPLVPPLSAALFEKVTQGKLRFDPSQYRTNRRGKKGLVAA